MKSIKTPCSKINFWLSLLFFGEIYLPNTALPQERNVKSVTILLKDSLTVVYDKSYALVVGVSDYTNGWPKLPNAVKDAKEVKEALEQHGFQVTILENPSKNILESAIKDFIFTYGMAPNDRLLFYFAGHGHTMRMTPETKWGFIVPADAPLPATGRGGFLQQSISMPQIEIDAKTIGAKHALFIFDSCFSGTIFTQGRALDDATIYKANHRVRQFITAGDENEQVPDMSIFKSLFVKALRGEGDLDGNGYMTGTELGQFLYNHVANYSRGAQHPQYGKLRDPAFDKGEFIFNVIPDTTKSINGPALPPPPPAEFGWLEIAISYEADVYVDGILQAAGATQPLVLKLLPGLHKIKVRGKLSYFYKENVVIEAGKSHKIVPMKI